MRYKISSYELFKAMLAGPMPENDGCLDWPRSVSSSGYGHFGMPNCGPTRDTHRAAWEETCGVIPKGFEICHTCDRRRCFRPSHLFPGTRLDNMIDAGEKGRTGKKLTPADVIEIRKLRSANVGRMALALRFGVKPRIISRITCRRIWVHV